MLLHRIYQVHHIPPDEVFNKDVGVQIFMYASELVAIEDEDEATKKAGKGKSGSSNNKVSPSLSQLSKVKQLL